MMNSQIGPLFYKFRVLALELKTNGNHKIVLVGFTFLMGNWDLAIISHGPYSNYNDASLLVEKCCQLP